MRILVIDDEELFCRVMRQHLTMAGYEAVCRGTGAEGLREAREHPPDLVLLDVRLPDMDGREICERLRATGQVPIIILSALGGEADIVRGLYAGADDYVVKPLRIAELLARIAVQLRRGRAQRADPARYDDGVLRVDPLLQRAEKRGQRLHLSRTEYRLLGALLESRGSTVSAEELHRRVWGEDEELDTRRVSLYVSYLRRKIEDDPSAPRYLRTVRGQGYAFRVPDAEGDA